MKISLSMIVKNESETLEKCLNTAKQLVDEIIIVDTGSTDDTKEIAVKMGAKVFDFEWNDDFAAARNYSLSKSSGDWNLILDADESIIQGTKDDLIKFAENNPKSIGNILRINKFENDGEEEESRILIARFVPNGAVYSGTIHEQITLPYPIKNTNIVINHTGYLNKDKSERNLKLLFRELDKNPDDDYILYQTAKSLFTGKRYEEADRYLKRAYSLIDKRCGYFKDLEITYLYNIIKLKNIYDLKQGLELIKNDKHQFENDPDFNFVCGIFYMELVLSDINKYIDYIDYIEQSYLKCLRIGENSRCSVKGTGSYKAAYNLGLLYETFGYKERAKEYYKISCDYGYKRAEERLNAI